MEKDYTEILKKAEEMIAEKKAMLSSIAKEGKLTIQQILNEEKYPDSIEINLGGPGNRGKLYFNADEPEVAMRRLANYFRVAEMRDELQEAAKTKSSEAGKP